MYKNLREWLNQIKTSMFKRLSLEQRLLKLQSLRDTVISISKRLIVLNCFSSLARFVVYDTLQAIGSSVIEEPMDIANTNSLNEDIIGTGGLTLIRRNCICQITC